MQEQIAYLLQSLSNTPEKKKIKLAFYRVGGAIDFVDAQEIIYCEADKDTTHVFLSDGRKFTAIRNLAFYAKPLEIDFNFFRISDKQLVNLDYLRSYEHSRDYQLTLSNGIILHASRRGGQDLKQYITESYKVNQKTAMLPSKTEETGLLKNILRRLLG